jgi:hypothetical protein
VDPVPETLLLRESGSARNRIRTSGSVARNSDLLTTEAATIRKVAGSFPDELIRLFFRPFFQPLYGPVMDSASNGNEYQESSWE